MARTKFNIPGRGFLNSYGSPVSWWLNIGIIDPGQTLLNTRISVHGAGNQPYGVGEVNAFGELYGVCTVGVTVLFAATDPGPPSFPPSDGIGADWVLRDAMGLRTEYAQPGNTATKGSFNWVTEANNPYVSKGMRKAPLGQQGYVYIGMDIYTGQTGYVVNFGSEPTVIYNLLVLDA